MHRTFYVAVSVIAVALSARPAAAFQPQPFVFYNPYTNMCLQPINGSMAPGAAIVQEPCDRSAAQEWIYIILEGRPFHFKNALSGLCLDARGKAANETPVQQWTCNDITNENWDIEANPKGGGAPVISRVSRSNSYCLDVRMGQKTAGLPMEIYHCHQTAAQMWQLNPDGSLVVPNVVDPPLLEFAASQQVSLYGLTPTSTKTNNCTSAQNGYVIEQSPVPGKIQPPNAAVYLTVCSQ